MIEISCGRGAAAVLRSGLTCAAPTQAHITKVIAPRAPMSDVMLLEATGINKSFAGVQALRDVSFGLRPGEVHALIACTPANDLLIPVASSNMTSDMGARVAITLVIWA